MTAYSTFLMLFLHDYFSCSFVLIFVDTNKWRVHFKCEPRLMEDFMTEEESARAFDAHAQRFDIDCPLNFPSVDASPDLRTMRSKRSRKRGVTWSADEEKWQAFTWSSSCVGDRTFIGPAVAAKSKAVAMYAAWKKNRCARSYFYNSPVCMTVFHLTLLLHIILY